VISRTNKYATGHTRPLGTKIFETIAIVHLEVQGWSGKLAGQNARISEVFTLLRRDGEWLITQKTFHWHQS
jgi:hypothetical protein